MPEDRRVTGDTPQGPSSTGIDAEIPRARLAGDDGQTVRHADTAGRWPGTRRRSPSPRPPATYGLAGPKYPRLVDPSEDAPAGARSRLWTIGRARDGRRVLAGADGVDTVPLHPEPPLRELTANGHRGAGRRSVGHGRQAIGPRPNLDQRAADRADRLGRARPLARGPHERSPGGRHRRPRERQASYGEVFAVREFRGLWAAQLLSRVGDQFAQVAIAILVYHRTGSPLLTAVAYALTYVPPIVGGPLLSGFADLWPRRRVMIICDLVRAVFVTVMAVPRLPFGGLCALLFGTVLLGAPFSSARQALLPDVLPGDAYVLGAAVGNMTNQGSQILGFVAGAAVVAVVDPYRTLGVDAATFAVSAFIVSVWVRPRPSPRREPGARASLWAVSRDGLAIVFSDPALRTLLLFGWLAGFTIVPEGIAAPYAHALHRGALTVGLLMAAIPCGTVVGAVVVGRLTRPSGRLRMMGWLAMLSCAPLTGSAIDPPLPVVLALWMLAGVGAAYQLAAAAAFVQRLSPATRGRAFGVAQSGLLGAQGLGVLVAGATAQAIGPTVTVGLAGLAGFVAAASLTVSWRRVRGQVIAATRGRVDRP